MQAFQFDAPRLPPEAQQVRRRVREFLAAERAAGRFVPHRCSWSTFDADFSRRAGAAGFIGVTWPKEYGGQGLSSLVRFVITEEMLAAGAPCFAHWVADRQSGPQILRNGTERARRELLPRICRGECFFGIGMSEPDSGSDLAAVRTRAVKAPGGWAINGSKIWTSNAHRVHYLIALVRTGEAGEDRHGGLTQFIVDMSQPGVTVRPIQNLAGGHEFNEVHFADYFVARRHDGGRRGPGLVAGDAGARLRALLARPLPVGLSPAGGDDQPRRQRTRIAGRLRRSAAWSDTWSRCGACRVR